MSYYGAGDYYGAGGLGGFLKGLGKAAVGFVTGGPLGAAGSIASSFAAGGGSGVPVLPAPGLRAAGQRFVPGGATGLMVGMPRRRRKMHYTNQKALTRANRRVDGFVRIAKKSLKHTNYKIVSKSAGKARRDLGPGHTHVK